MAALRHHRLNGEVDVAAVAALIGDDARAAMLLALGGGVPLSAADLAARARITPPTASGHLAKLVRGGLLRAERRGRFTYFSIAHPGVSRAIEALGALAPMRPPAALSESSKAHALRAARTCYDHLAGQLGVALFGSLERSGTLRERSGDVALGRHAAAAFARLGIDLETLRSGRRHFAATCIDWTERRPHLSGALGAALCAAFFEHAWCVRVPASRAVRLTPKGVRALRETFGVEFGAADVR